MAVDGCENCGDANLSKDSMAGLTPRKSTLRDKFGVMPTPMLVKHEMQRLLEDIAWDLASYYEITPAEALERLSHVFPTELVPQP